MRNDYEGWKHIWPSTLIQYNNGVAFLELLSATLLLVLLRAAWQMRSRLATPQHNPDMPCAITQLLAPQGPVVPTIRARFPNAMAAYAFGSQVQGPAGSESDLDLAVLVAGYADPLTLWDAAGDLADVTGCPVDLLDLRAASTVMQYQVITTGQSLWSVGLQAGLFETFV